MWQSVKHLFEDHDSDPKFKPEQVDKEGSSSAPQADLFEGEPIPSEEFERRDAEDILMDEALQVHLDAEPLRPDEGEDNIADIFGDFESDDEMGAGQKDSMTDALLMAGVENKQARIAAHAMMLPAPLA